MSDFKEILNENHKEYPFRIKTVVPVSDGMYDDMVRFLKKYRPVEIGKVARTIHQAHPLDFGDLESSEVFIIDVVLGLPVSSYVLQQEMTFTWRLPEKNIVVRNAYEAMEQLSDYIRAEDDIIDRGQDADLTKGSYLSTSPNYMDHETVMHNQMMAGDTYNSGFKDALAKLAATRADEVYPTAAKLFDYVKDHPNSYADDFNKDIDGAPQIKPKWDADVKAVDDDEVTRSQIQSVWGNFWHTKTVSRPYKDFVDELELVLNTPELEKSHKKYKAIKDK